MKRNSVIVHVFIFFVLGSSSAMGQNSGQQNSVSKQQLTAPAKPTPADSLTFLAKRYLDKMEKSRTHQIRGKILATYPSAKRHRRKLSSYLEAHKGKKQPKDSQTSAPPRDPPTIKK
ncbi:MAG: hypothetical protein KTR30_26100 [Saprospiraceae bacterium]|nr:hypothetical protein [Saprospiraceae bacterium]